MIFIPDIEYYLSLKIKYLCYDDNYIPLLQAGWQENPVFCKDQLSSNSKMITNNPKKFNTFYKLLKITFTQSQTLLKLRSNLR